MSRRSSAPGCGTKAGIIRSFLHDGHRIGVPLNDAPASRCCLQWGHSNFMAFLLVEITGR